MDPLAEETLNWSPYAFCNNNPVRFIDPTGMSTEEPPSKSSKLFKIHEIKNGVNWLDKNGSWTYNSKSQTWIGFGESKGNNINAYKTSTLHKIIKSGTALANAYGGYNEITAGVASLLAPEPTGVTKALGAYGIADGLTRIVSTPVALYGTLTENERLENAPSNILGLAGNLIDNMNSSSDTYKTGGKAQLWGELAGDFGLSRRNLINTLEKEATTNMDKIIKVGKIVKEAIFVPLNATTKAKKLK